MPIAIGLLPSQQESFDHHEELSKLLNETDVFYVPFQNDFHNNHDLSDLTKRFDEDILNKHLVVTFRDIGYSLFLDCVQSIPDQYDKSKTRVSGKMIVDGICIRFIGCFDCNNKTRERSDVQQINGVGRVLLDEDYYRELQSTQIIIEEKTMEAMTQTEELMPKTKGRSRTISENILGKNQRHNLKSPPSSLSNSQSRLHSPNHYPYTIRSPRTTNINKQQYQASSPIIIESSSVSRSSGFHSSFMSPSSSVPSSFNENPIDFSQQHQLQILSTSPQFSSSFQNATTMPIRIPATATATTTTTTIPTSLPHLTGIFPITESHSLPTYFLPPTNLAYIITNANQHPTQPIQIIASINPHSLQNSNTNYSILSHRQTNSYNETSLSFLQNKRPDNEENKQTQPMDTNKPFEEQLPFKKRRYAGQPSSSTSVQSPMQTNHPDDDEASNESMKK